MENFFRYRQLKKQIIESCKELPGAVKLNDVQVKILLQTEEKSFYYILTDDQLVLQRSLCGFSAGFPAGVINCGTAEAETEIGKEVNLTR